MVFVSRMMVYAGLVCSRSLCNSFMVCDTVSHDGSAHVWLRENSTVLSRSQNWCSVNEADRLQLRRQTVLARRAGHGKATCTVAGSPGVWDQKIITSCW